MLRSKLQGVALPTHKILTVNIDGGFQAKVLLQLPPNMDTSGNTKYPMLVDVYGGPDSYSVRGEAMLAIGSSISNKILSLCPTGDNQMDDGLGHISVVESVCDLCQNRWTRLGTAR